MTITEMRKGYEQEVAYQKHMMKNLGYWFQLCVVLSGVGIVLLSLYHATHPVVAIIGGVIFGIGALGMLLFGYTGWRGQQNLKKLVNDYEAKLRYLHSHHADQFKVRTR
ncbi:DUF202 domain-containing protein [Lacticaseibacillus sp. N501-2]|uniref:DUF202 domain-containing protein n=1 Tax=Lacticaseibacillus salsurae TaxID=3367729 RepID=UPI0038B3377D